MSVPTYDQFIEPLLRYLAEHQTGVSAKAAHDYAASALGLSDADKQQLLPSGAQPIYKNRTGWAHDRLKRAGLSSSPRRGFWKITGKGITFIQNHSGPFPVGLAQNLAMGFVGVKLKQNSPPNPIGVAGQPVPQAPSAIPLASPDDRLEQALDELRQAAQSELLELLAVVSPTYFETIVLDLLHRMGYGASRADLQRVGGTGDGGIDGVISLDRLGLEKVYVQAKRWQGSVGAPELRGFYGALAQQKAKKGVFITTSGYTAKATDYAKSVEGIVLIDGTRLVGLMIECELGVTTRAVKIPKIDGDYFDEDSA